MKEKMISFLCVIGLLGCTQSESMELQGRIAVKGSERDTYLSIYDQKTHKSYKIKNKNAFNLMQKQDQTINLEAKLIKKAIGPGFPAVIEVTEVKED